MAQFDAVNHPAHYTAHPSGVECIQITEHMNFCIGNAMKYLWRAGLKKDAITDLEKAIWYIKREIARRRTADLIPPLPETRLRVPADAIVAADGTEPPPENTYTEGF